LDALHSLYERFGDEVEFYVVYIKEAHPEDGWVLRSNREADISVSDPTSVDERTEVAQTCSMRLQIRMPVLIDGIDNRVASAYGGWPDRMYLISRDGRIAYQGAEGPFGFKPAELERAIESELASSQPG
jgi:hypothetical protein